MKKIFCRLKENWIWITICTVAALTICLLLADILTPPRFAGPPKVLQVNGVVYYTQTDGCAKPVKLKNVHYDENNRITSTILNLNSVEKDNQANFNCLGSFYTFVDGELMLQVEGKWYRCWEKKTQ